MEYPFIAIYLGVGNARVVPADLVKRLADTAHQLDMGLPQMLETALRTYLSAVDECAPV